jgi:hypothetical protein
MLRWLIGVVAAVAFFWGLNRILIALTSEATTTDLLLGVVGVALAGLSFVYLGYLLGRVQRSV